MLGEEDSIPGPVPTGALAGPCFWSKRRGPHSDPGQEGSSWGLSLPSPPSPALSRNKEVGMVPSAALGQPTSALFLEALREGDCSFLSPKPSCQKAFPAVSSDVSRRGALA